MSLLDPSAAAPVDPTKPKLSLAPPTAAPLGGIPAPTVAAPSAPVDRLALAQSNFDTFAKSSDPAYQKTLRDATSQAAGQGGLGSGMLRTSLGDAASNRQLQLDTLRADLVNKATEGSIADAQTAYGQALSSAQQGLATRIGEGQLSQGQQAQDTSRLSVTGSLENQKGQLDLARGEATGTVGGQQTVSAQQLAAQREQAAGALALAQKTQETSAGQSQQQIDLAKKTADINAAFQQGQLTLAQKDQALKELANSQQNTIATSQLSLAGKAQTAQETQAKAALAEQTAARLQQGAQFNASLAQSGDQFRQSLEQNATQFGLSQEQTQKLATLQDATANRSIDVSQAQGQQQLLVQLASIIGGPTGGANPAALAAIALQFGVVIPPPGGKRETATPTPTEGK